MTLKPGPEKMCGKYEHMHADAEKYRWNVNN
jgi:hypothetical protein